MHKHNRWSWALFAVLSLFALSASASDGLSTAAPKKKAAETSVMTTKVSSDSSSLGTSAAPTTRARKVAPVTRGSEK